MAPWSSFGKYLLQQMAAHPEMQKAFRSGSLRMRNHPSFVRTQMKVRSWKEQATAFWTKQQQQQKSSTTTNSSSTSQNQSGSRNNSSSTGSSQSEGFFTQANKQRLVVSAFWARNKGKIYSFIAANFMGIILIFQFGHAIWEVIKNAFREYAKARATAEHQAQAWKAQHTKKHEKQEGKANRPSSMDSHPQSNGTPRLQVVEPISPYANVTAPFSSSFSSDNDQPNEDDNDEPHHHQHAFEHSSSSVSTGFGEGLATSSDSNNMEFDGTTRLPVVVEHEVGEEHGQNRKLMHKTTFIKAHHHLQLFRLPRLPSDPNKEHSKDH